MLPTLLLRVHCVANSGDFEGGKGKAAELVHHLCRRAFEVTGICHSSPHGRPTMMVGLQAARGRRRRHRNRRPMSRTQLNIINTRVSSPLQVNTEPKQRRRSHWYIGRTKPLHHQKVLPFIQLSKSTTCVRARPAYARHREEEAAEGGGGKKQKNTKGRRGEGQPAFRTYTIVAQATGQTGRPGGLVDTSPSSSSKVTRSNLSREKLELRGGMRSKLEILRPH